jgi:hypothetical protein
MLFPFADTPSPMPVGIWHWNSAHLYPL